MCNTTLQVYQTARNTGVHVLISTLATDVRFPTLFFGGLAVFSIVLNAIYALSLERVNQWENVLLVDNSRRTNCKYLSWNDNRVTPKVTGAGTVQRKSWLGRWCDTLDLHPQPQHNIPSVYKYPAFQLLPLGGKKKKKKKAESKRTPSFNNENLSCLVMMATFHWHNFILNHRRCKINN